MSGPFFIQEYAVNKPELLSPAGSLKAMQYAFAYGADAVYAGQPRYSLRVRNNEFDMLNLAEGINQAHALGKQFYVVVNIAPHNSKLKTFLKDMEPVIAMKPDALIMSDPGLIMMIRERWPEQVIHLSVQANTVNYAATRFWQQVGCSRVILSRELSLKEIAEIRKECPDMELEVFVHGALCIAYSGRCLLSGYINKRDANQGTCTNACRWNYNAHPAKETTSDDIVAITENASSQSAKQYGPSDEHSSQVCEKGSNDIFLLQEKTRPGEYMPAFEDEHGTYIMNSKDLRAVQHVKQLTEMGVTSLKIEGRTKSFYYAARTAQVYRKAIDDAVAGKDFDMSLMDTLEGLANRGYTEGFYRRHVHDEYQNYQNGNSKSDYQQFVGEFTGKPDNGMATVIVKNKFEVGDRIELLTPAGNQTITLSSMEDLKGHKTEVAPGSGHTVRIPVPESFDTKYALLVRHLPRT